MHDDDESELFRREVADVKPLGVSSNLILSKAAESIPSPGQQYSREAAQRSIKQDEGWLPTSFIEPVRPESVISFRRPGIQNGVFQRLQKGAYEVEAILDLHGLNVEQARKELDHFIHECVQYDVRLALISHGKGKRNKDQIPLLKSYLVRWLPMFPDVMAFNSAQKRHGGTGAVYVLLRKSEAAKELTRLRLGLTANKPSK